MPTRTLLLAKRLNPNMATIIVSQSIQTIGFDEAVKEAPARIIEIAKEKSNAAIPTVIGKNEAGHWVVICWYANEKPEYMPKIEYLSTMVKGEPGHS